MIYSLVQREFIYNFFKNNAKININDNILEEYIGNDKNENNSRDIRNA